MSEPITELWESMAPRTVFLERPVSAVDPRQTGSGSSLRPRARRSAVDDDAEALLDPAVAQAVAASDGSTRIPESADAELVLGEREAGVQGLVGDNEVTTSEASLSALQRALAEKVIETATRSRRQRTARRSSTGKNPAGRREPTAFSGISLRPPARCTSLRHRE
jgi:hypothetical protein